MSFCSWVDNNHEIYVGNVDGSDLERLTDNKASDLYPSWSPDGRHIVFYSGRDDDLEIYVMDADGSNQTRMTNSPGDYWYPAWSPVP